MDPKVTQNSSHVVGVLKVSELAEIYLAGLLAAGEGNEKHPIITVKLAYSYAGAMIGMRNELLRSAQDADSVASGGETTRQEALESIDPDEDAGSDGEVEVSGPVTEREPAPVVDKTPEVPPPSPVMADPFPAAEAPTTAPVSGGGDQTAEFSSAPKSLDDLRGNQ